MAYSDVLRNNVQPVSHSVIVLLTLAHPDYTPVKMTLTLRDAMDCSEVMQSDLRPVSHSIIFLLTLADLDYTPVRNDIESEGLNSLQRGAANRVETSELLYGRPPRSR